MTCHLQGALRTMVTRLAAVFLLAVPLLLMPDTSAGAGIPKIDLRDFMPPSVIGRTSNWASSTGVTSTSELVDVTYDLGGWLYMNGTTTSEGYVSVSWTLEKGNKMFFAALAVGELNGAAIMLWPRDGKPVKLQPFLQKVGKVYRSKLIRGEVVDVESGATMGRFWRREQGVLAGFESLSTPAGDYATTLRQDWSTDTYMDLYYEADIEIRALGTYWLVAGEGSVGQTQRTLLYRAGVLTTDTGYVDSWRVSTSSSSALPPGAVPGVSIPMSEPPVERQQFPLPMMKGVTGFPEATTSGSPDQEWTVPANPTATPWMSSPWR